MPFLDKEFLGRGDAYQSRVEDGARRAQHGEVVLRKAFEDMLPESIVWRQKEQFSGRRGATAGSTLKKITSEAVSDRDMSLAAERFPINPRATRRSTTTARYSRSCSPSQTAAQCVPSVPSVACSTAEALAWDESFRQHERPLGPCRLRCACEGPQTLMIHPPVYPPHGSHAARRNFLPHSRSCGRRFAYLGNNDYFCFRKEYKCTDMSSLKHRLRVWSLKARLWSAAARLPTAPRDASAFEKAGAAAVVLKSLFEEDIVRRTESLTDESAHTESADYLQGLSARTDAGRLSETGQGEPRALLRYPSSSSILLLHGGRVDRLRARMIEQAEPMLWSSTS